MNFWTSELVAERDEFEFCGAYFTSSVSAATNDAAGGGDGTREVGATKQQLVTVARHNSSSQVHAGCGLDWEHVHASAERTWANYEHGFIVLHYGL